jgi:hypothetical protein
MDPAELIDSRPNDGPLALWRNKIVLGVHHDGVGFLFWFDWNPTMMTTGAEYWLRQNWIPATAAQG